LPCSVFFLWQATAPPDISGNWTNETGAQVVIAGQESGKYDGTIEFVGISLGSDDGLRVGDTLEVFRGQESLGRITIRRILKNSSIARIDAHVEEIRRGDSVTTSPGSTEPEVASVLPRRLQQYTTDEAIKLVACSPDGKFVAVAHDISTLPSPNID
jgi:hypothetical protein